MELHDIAIRVATADCDRAAAVATMVDSGGLYIEDYSDMLEQLPEIAHFDYIDDSLLGKDTNHALIHVYVPVNDNPAEKKAYLEQLLTAADIEFTSSVNTVADDDWAENWKKFYKPFKIGKRLVVRPSWEEYTTVDGETVLTLDPGMAFGTGEHETTRLCLEQLERLTRDGDTVLDVGCGSGILGIGALLLGAKSVTAVDIDLNSVATAKENASINGVGDRFIAVTGNATEKAFADTLPKDVDIIAANIVADVIIPLSDFFFGALRDGGYLITGGVIDIREDEVRTALEKAGFVIEQRTELKGWVTYAAVKSK